MPKKTQTKTGSLSRGEARRAVLGVKKARASAKKIGASKKASPWYIKRYLGHFGFGLEAAPGDERGSKRSTPKKRIAAKKGSRDAKKYRRAS